MKLLAGVALLGGLSGGLAAVIPERASEIDGYLTMCTGLDFQPKCENLTVTTGACEVMPSNFEFVGSAAPSEGLTCALFDSDCNLSEGFAAVTYPGNSNLSAESARTAWTRWQCFTDDVVSLGSDNSTLQYTSVSAANKTSHGKIASLNRRSTLHLNLYLSSLNDPHSLPNGVSIDIETMKCYFSENHPIYSITIQKGYNCGLWNGVNGCTAGAATSRNFNGNVGDLRAIGYGAGPWSIKCWPCPPAGCGPSGNAAPPGRRYISDSPMLRDGDISKRFGTTASLKSRATSQITLYNTRDLNHPHKYAVDSMVCYNVLEKDYSMTTPEGWSCALWVSEGCHGDGTGADVKGNVGDLNAIGLGNPTWSLMCRPCPDSRCESISGGTGPSSSPIPRAALLDANKVSKRSDTGTRSAPPVPVITLYHTRNLNHPKSYSIDPMVCYDMVETIYSFTTPDGWGCSLWNGNGCRGNARWLRGNIGDLHSIGLGQAPYSLQCWPCLAAGCGPVGGSWGPKRRSIYGSPLLDANEVSRHNAEHAVAVDSLDWSGDAIPLEPRAEPLSIEICTEIDFQECKTHTIDMAVCYAMRPVIKSINTRGIDCAVHNGEGCHGRTPKINGPASNLPAMGLAYAFGSINCWPCYIAGGTCSGWSALDGDVDTPPSPTVTTGTLSAPMAWSTIVSATPSVTGRDVEAKLSKPTHTITLCTEINYEGCKDNRLEFDVCYAMRPTILSIRVVEPMICVVFDGEGCASGAFALRPHGDPNLASKGKANAFMSIRCSGKSRIEAPAGTDDAATSPLPTLSAVARMVDIDQSRSGADVQMEKRDEAWSGIYVCSEAGWSGECEHLTWPAEKVNVGACQNLPDRLHDTVRSAGADKGLSCRLHTEPNCDTSKWWSYIGQFIYPGNDDVQGGPWKSAWCMPCECPDCDCSLRTAPQRPGGRSLERREDIYDIPPGIFVCSGAGYSGQCKHMTWDWGEGDCKNLPEELRSTVQSASPDFRSLCSLHRDLDCQGDSSDELIFPGNHNFQSSGIYGPWSSVSCAPCHKPECNKW